MQEKNATGLDARGFENGTLFLEALEQGEGSAVRDSSTLMQVTIYEATRLSDGTVLRISGSQQSAAALLLDLLLPVMIISMCAMILCAILSRKIAQWIVGPINRLDLEHPLQNDSYEAKYAFPEENA